MCLFGALLLVYKAVSLGGIYNTSPFEGSYVGRVETETDFGDRTYLVESNGRVVIFLRSRRVDVDR